MRLLSLLHRWTGAITGLLLAVIGLSGTALVWEGYWIGLPGAGDPVIADPAALGRVVETARATGPDLSYITFASEEIGLHQAIYHDGSGAYFSQDAVLVERWESFWERPELWLFDLHHYLFLGEAGKTITGILGLLLLAFTISGLILWWRTRKTFRLRLFPARWTASAVVRHHRDLGAVASPLLLLVAVTGSAMVFPAVTDAVLSPLAKDRSAIALPANSPAPTAQTDWPVLMTRAQSAFPQAYPRRLMMPREAGAPVAVRFRQDFEWTPNGRSYIYLDPFRALVLAVDDPAEGSAADAVREKLYPIHAGKVGGLAWQMALTFAGLALVMLGTLAMWSFWFAGSTKRAVGKLRPRDALRA
ncbi:peptidase [Aurantiacibacter gangjinensis]|uniref:Peptidase n=1 Tax=Aurantiacibacter gangjinensis TaxID=502682 RepID=A0A0G9MKI0_9SPHN|nr:peptidase [Aurantiacibacter gangjinensis]